MIKAHEILLYAASIVKGARNTQHGETERSFTHIAQMWTQYLHAKKGLHWQSISARDVAQMMVLLKIIRSVQGTPVPDHFIDEAGYAAIAGELASLESLQETVTKTE
jgi:hypothetical protein